MSKPVESAVLSSSGSDMDTTPLRTQKIMENTQKFERVNNNLELSLIYVENQFCSDCVWRTEHFIDNGTCLLT